MLPEPPITQLGPEYSHKPGNVQMAGGTGHPLRSRGRVLRRTEPGRGLGDVGGGGANPPIRVEAGSILLWSRGTPHGHFLGPTGRKPLCW